MLAQIKSRGVYSTLLQTNINHIRTDMESLSSHQTTVAHSQETNRTAVECELCPALKKLEEIAVRKYGTYRGLAQRSDDSQETFHPVATNFIHASQLIMKAALRDTQRIANNAK